MREEPIETTMHSVFNRIDSQAASTDIGLDARKTEEYASKPPEAPIPATVIIEPP
jgi:hypothetical protein